MAASMLGLCGVGDTSSPCQARLLGLELTGHATFGSHVDPLALKTDPPMSIISDRYDKYL